MPILGTKLLSPQLRGDFDGSSGSNFGSRRWFDCHELRADTVKSRQPNVIIFLSDDVGWGEHGFQGNKEIPTPSIDSIAKNGVRCTNAYIAATYCSPSRAGLMTGRYPTRFGHEWNEGLPTPKNKAGVFGLPLTETTLAARLKALGYATCCIGKWHLGFEQPYFPMARGFDEYYGTLGNTESFSPKRFIDSRVSEKPGKVTEKDFYTTDAYAARAVDWIGKQKGPYFLYLPFNAQHDPLQATQKYLDRFPNIKDEKRRVFAAMMSAMDDAVGKVLAKVREMGQEENTLVFYWSDNGGPTRQTTSSNGPLAGSRRPPMKEAPESRSAFNGKARFLPAKTTSTRFKISMYCRQSSPLPEARPRRNGSSTASTCCRT